MDENIAEKFFKEIVMKLAPFTEEHALKLAQESSKLILGIDDFAIRKGHNYNTGIHDLRGETLLAMLECIYISLIVSLILRMTGKMNIFCHL